MTGNPTKKYAFALMLMFVGIAVLAVDDSAWSGTDYYTWTGAAEDGYWTNKLNWVKNATTTHEVPKANTVAIFNPGDGGSVSINPAGMESGSPAFMLFKTGTVTFSRTLYFSRPYENYAFITVEDGARCEINGDLQARGDRRIIAKDGPGTLYINGGKILPSGSQTLLGIIVSNGTVQIENAPSRSTGTARLEIKNGATFSISRPDFSRPGPMGYDTVVDIEKGGKYLFRTAGLNYTNDVVRIKGEGAVDLLPGAPASTLTMRLVSAGEPFTGTIGTNIAVVLNQTAYPIQIGPDTYPNGRMLTAGTNLLFSPSATPYRFGPWNFITDDAHIGAFDINGDPLVFEVSSSLAIYNDTTFSGGTWYFPLYYNFVYRADNVNVTVLDGLYARTPAVDPNFTERVLPTPSTVVIRADKAGSSFTLKGGIVHLGLDMGDSRIPMTMDLEGGELVVSHFNISGTTLLPAAATAENPVRFNLKGSKLTASMKETTDGLALLHPAEEFRASVFEKGVEINTIDHLSMSTDTRTVRVRGPLHSGVAEGTDGGVTFRGGVRYDLYFPLLINGPVSLLDGEARIFKDADLATTPAFLGTGGFTLWNSSLAFHVDATSSKTLELCTDPGAKFTVAGSAMIRIKQSTGAYANTVNVNGSYVRERGGILYIEEYMGSSGTALSSTFKVAGGIATGASGQVQTPIAICNASNGKVFPATYSAENGIQILTDVTEGLEGGENRFAQILGSTASIPAGVEKKVDGIRVDNKLTIAEGGKLTVGSGALPALMILGNATDPRGTGTVDFGSREGVVSVRWKPVSDGAGGYSPLTVPWSFAGSGGVTFVAMPQRLNGKFRLNGASTYTGGTVINALQVEPGCDEAFGSGDVKVGGGELTGGRISFTVEGVSIANNLHISGWGVNRTTAKQTSGAIVFVKSGTVSGNVELEAETRISADEDATGVISGTVSGDRLVVYDGAGVVKLTGANTYTGGTEIVSSTLSLARSNGAGTGAVTVNGGTLRFENAGPINVANDITGIGTVQLNGSAPVVFGGDVSGFDGPLDLAGTQQVFTEMPPFAAVTNSSDKVATFTLADNLGTVHLGDLEFAESATKFNLLVGEGTVLDLDGAALTVRTGKNFSRLRIVNGTFSEMRPERGFSISIR